MGETLWRHVRRIHDESLVRSMTDGELVACFAESKDRDAFEELFRRCAPLVWGVCARTLGATPEAEDAFQAVFLLLVQNARKIRDRSRVASWLYGATRKVAGRAARRRTRRDRRVGCDQPDR
jgi:DNA-directed RNA polymerase specialized sigma24 family protein